MNYGFLKDNNGNKIYINDNSIYHEGKNLKDVINSKQDKLTAGTGIEITGENTINNIQGNYSTDEQVIGKWIDGKTLFRKVIKTTMAEAPSNGTYVNKDVAIGTHIDFGFVEKTILISGTQHMSLPYINNAGYSTKCFIEKNGLHLVLTNGNSNFNNCETYVIIKYTKKTNQNF